MRGFVVAKRIIKQVIKDKRTLALLFVAPLFIIFLLSVILDSTIEKPNLTAVNLPSELTAQLKKHADVKTSADLKSSMDSLKARNTDAVLIFSDSAVTVNIEGTETSVTAAVKKAVSSAIAEYSKANIKSTVQSEMQEKAAKIQQSVQSSAQAAVSKGIQTGIKEALENKVQVKNFTIKPRVPNVKIEIPPVSSDINIKTTDVNYSYINGSDNMATFDTIAPMMMGFFIFFFVFLLAGISFLRERISGTLDRLLATPIKRFEIVFGYFVGFGIFALIQTFIIQLFMVYILNIPIKGSFLLVLLINILLAAGSLALGTLLSAFARSEFQLFQFIPIVIVPQILFCGLFSLRAAPIWVVVLSKIFPLTYGADALVNVMLRGQGFASIAFDLAVMAGYMVLFLILNSLALKKYRKL